MNPAALKRLQKMKTAPAVYIEGKGALSAALARGFAGSVPAVFLVEKKILGKFRKEFAPIMSVSPEVVFFGGECSLEEIARLKETLSVRPVSIIAAGGGKLLDASKILAARFAARLMTVPTSCATCAAFTPIAPTYHPDGRKRKTVDTGRAPDVCAADYGILARQPRRLMVSGIADAVAKYYEAAAFTEAHPSALGDPSVRAARAVSSEILETAFRFSSKALDFLSSGRYPAAFGKAISLTIMLPGVVSALGGKKCRTAAAHALANGLTYLKAARGALHGEKVGWGILVQLVLEGKAREFAALKKFFRSIGAPTTLARLGVKKTDFASLAKALRAACAPDESMRFMARKIGVKELYEAVIETERRG